MMRFQFLFITERNKIHKETGEGHSEYVARELAWGKIRAKKKKSPPHYSGFIAKRLP